MFPRLAIPASPVLFLSFQNWVEIFQSFISFLRQNPFLSLLIIFSMRITFWNSSSLNESSRMLKAACLLDLDLHFGNPIPSKNLGSGEV